MKHLELRQSFTDYFQNKGHLLVPSSSLIPAEEDKSVLLTTAGMQQFKQYYLNNAGAPAVNCCSIQKCFRSDDIDKVGDETHLTFFEMLGHFSFGGYFKEEALLFARDYLTSFGIDSPLVASFHPKDSESASILGKLGVVYTMDDKNFWGPIGEKGACGYCVEFYLNGVEVWNVVFNEFYKENGKLTPLKVKGVDMGCGLERLLAAINNCDSVFETDLFPSTEHYFPEKERRIIKDTARAICFLFSDGVTPSNKGAGYLLRRMMRKLFLICRNNDEWNHLPLKIWNIFMPIYDGIYPASIYCAMKDEKVLFDGVLRKSTRILSKYSSLTGGEAYDIYSSCGVPLEIIQEKFPVNMEEFEQARLKHQEISRGVLNDL